MTKVSDGLGLSLHPSHDGAARPVSKPSSRRVAFMAGLARDCHRRLRDSAARLITVSFQVSPTLSGIFEWTVYQRTYSFVTFIRLVTQPAGKY